MIPHNSMSHYNLWFLGPGSRNYQEPAKVTNAGTACVNSPAGKKPDYMLTGSLYCPDNICTKTLPLLYLDVCNNSVLYNSSTPNPG
ncbi:hypothetical protein BJ508DRAFT_175831 [Ascobolus immersus RN42]|uniref:Uncharacterized protein n=1 Tax=Ascobolus immersus RN42 TaxID=1160509 RepID=A0A3N4HVC6_ASCIM|nr:hypothetical protein BJ508DRAFT_175831 [Ascobolus immersus RN42]